MAAHYVSNLDDSIFINVISDGIIVWFIRRISPVEFTCCRETDTKLQLPIIIEQLQVNKVLIDFGIFMHRRR